MEDKEIKIDYLSVTFPLIVEKEDNELAVVHDTVEMISNFLCVNYLEVKREEYSTLRYKYQYSLGDSIILRLSGPESDSGYRTCHLELRGEGCRDFERRNQEKTWYELFMYLLRLNGEFKRIDIAVDDLSGSDITLSQINEKIKNNYYTSRFNKPPKYIECKGMGSSLTFGTALSPIQLCIYDKKAEQLQKGKQVIDDYWVRYEMRFRHEKAQAVAYALIKDYQDTNDLICGFNMRLFAYEALYGLLDIKEDNNYSRADQKKVSTDPNWVSFLGEVQKAIIKAPDEKEFSYEAAFDWVEPKMIFYLVVRFIQCKQDFESFFYEMLKVIYKRSNFDDKKMKKLNKFLCQMNIKSLSPEQFTELRTNLFSKIEDMEMPF